MVKAFDNLAEARTLISSGQTRLETYNRLYYAAHYARVALLALLGKPAKTHNALINEFGVEWIARRKFPASYAKLLTTLSKERDTANHGECVPPLQRDVSRRMRTVEALLKQASKEIPPFSAGRALEALAAENPKIREFSFDFYCPYMGYDYTRFTIWTSKARITEKWAQTVRKAGICFLKQLNIKYADKFVLGLNSLVNYGEKHLLLLDVDYVDKFPTHKLQKEPGFLYRTANGFHFAGWRLYEAGDWKTRMRKYSIFACKNHVDLSIKRGYATVRLTASPWKPGVPAFLGRFGQ